MDGRVRELRLERGERFGREHFGREFRSEGRFDSRREFRPGEGRWFHDFRESGFALKR